MVSVNLGITVIIPSFLIDYFPGIQASVHTSINISHAERFISTLSLLCKGPFSIYLGGGGGFAGGYPDLRKNFRGVPRFAQSPKGEYTQLCVDKNLKSSTPLRLNTERSLNCEITVSSFCSLIRLLTSVSLYNCQVRNCFPQDPLCV